MSRCGFFEAFMLLAVFWVSWICSLVSNKNVVPVVVSAHASLLWEVVTPSVQLSVSGLGSRSFPCAPSSCISKKNCWFFRLFGFLLVRTEWQLPSSLYTEPLTKSLSNMADLMVCVSAGLLGPVPFLPHAANRDYPSCICRPLVLFSTTHLLAHDLSFGFYEGLLCSVCPAKCWLPTCLLFLLTMSIMRFSGLWFSLSVHIAWFVHSGCRREL